jgi:hypothetical protein
MSIEMSLPAGFEMLEPFVPDWSLPSEFQRRTKRVDASMDEHRRFYAAIMAEWPRVAEHLKNSPPYELDAKTERLLNLAMMAMEAGVVVKVFDANDSPHAIDFRRLKYLYEA